MKGIFVGADPKNDRGGEWWANVYYPYPHPHNGWINILKLDTLNMGFNPTPPVKWKEYDVAFVLTHGSCIGSATKIRRLNRKIKIVVIVEPPPAFWLNRTPFPELNLMVSDFNSADVIAQENECYITDWKVRFGSNAKKIFWLPTPLNIPEFTKLTDLSKREKIVASTTHCNFWESPKRSWEVMKGSLLAIRKLGFRTRFFYAQSVEDLRSKLDISVDETCPFIWDNKAHIIRLNQCYVLVDDNICPASGHMCLEVCALGIPSVGSNDYIDHLFPELGLPSVALNPPHFRRKSEVRLLSEKLNQLLNDKSYYDSMVKLGMENMHKYYSYEVLGKRIREILEQ